MNYYGEIKKKLFDIIEAMENDPVDFVVNPKKDFTKKRSWTFSKMLKSIITMGSGSLSKEIAEFWNEPNTVPTTSSFVQQRAKIKPQAFHYLFKTFTAAVDKPILFKNYRVFAADGSDFNVFHNPKDQSTYHHPSATEHRGSNMIHLNALFDIGSGLYMDAIADGREKSNENASLNEMIDRSDIQEKAIILADRNYESYNVFAHIMEKGWKFVVRAKDITSNGILSALNLPDEEEFDVTIDLEITRKNTAEVRKNRDYFRFISSTSPFDYLEIGSKDTYPMRLRVIRFKLNEKSDKKYDNYECLITNLMSDEASTKNCKKLYNLRWGIETSFRELKYTIGAVCFHTKKTEFVHQELFARLTLFNYCRTICNRIGKVKSTEKYDYAINFSDAVYICKKFLLSRKGYTQSNIKNLIQSHILPIKPFKKYPRKMKNKSFIDFNYRLA